MSKVPNDVVLEARRLERWDNSEDINELRSVIQDGTILEVGCGTGRILEDLSKNLRNAFFIGIDNIEYFLDIATRKNITNAVFIKANAVDRIFLEQSFDTVLFRDSINVIGNRFGEEGVTKSLRNAHFYLKDGGLLVIRDSLSTPSTKVRVRFDSEEAINIFAVFAKRFKKMAFDGSASVELDVGDLTLFLGNFERIKTNPKIRISPSHPIFRYSLEEYDRLLQRIGFKGVTTKFYKFAKKLIPKEILFDYDKLPKTYCMLVYTKK